MDAEELQRPLTALHGRDPVCVSPDTSVREVVNKLQELGAGCVFVTDEAGHLVGIFTERDVLKKLAPLGAEAANLPVSELMTPRPTALHQDDSIVYALHQMHVGGYRHIPLVDDMNRPVGVVSIRTAVDYLAERLEGTLQNAESGAGPS